MIFSIDGKEVNVEIHPPSVAYRNQFGAYLGSLYGVDKNENISVKDTIFWEMSEDELKGLVKVCSTLTFEEKEHLDLNEKGNYKTAISVVTGFFSQLRRTTKK